jgi:hypothetical protein
VATNPPPDLVLSALNGRTHSVREWLTTFHLLFVALGTRDQSAWIMPTARRVLYDYEQANCRVAWLVAGDASDARRLLGAKAAENDLVFLDPDLTAVRAFGLSTLPAIVHLGIDGTVVNAVEGWDPPAWRALTVVLSQQVGWSRPRIPDPKDPGPFQGAPLPAPA